MKETGQFNFDDERAKQCKEIFDKIICSVGEVHIAYSELKARLGEPDEFKDAANTTTYEWRLSLNTAFKGVDNFKVVGTLVPDAGIECLEDITVWEVLGGSYSTCNFLGLLLQSGIYPDAIYAD
jgi:hypothetical protein